MGREGKGSEQQQQLQQNSKEHLSYGVIWMGWTWGSALYHAILIMLFYFLNCHEGKKVFHVTTREEGKK